MTQALVLPFPIRPKYLAQIVVPRDMTKQEADRLCAFVMSVAAPATGEPPGEPSRKEPK